jgi:anaerobic selenocysteine-containing dehydrogenase
MVVQYTDKVLEPVGDAKAAWWIFSKIGEKLGLDTVKLGKLTEDLNDLAVLRTIKDGAMLFDQTNLLSDGYCVAKSPKIFGWVCESVLPEKRWRLVTPALKREMERVLAFHREPEKLLLVSMREDGHLNTQFTHGDSNEPPPGRINPADAARYGLTNDLTIQLSTSVGIMQVKIFISDEVRPNTIEVPHGYHGLGNVSNLTSEFYGVNPISGMVKQTAIQITVKSFNKSNGSSLN